MPALRVLITNIRMASRTGTELYVFDLARGLMRRGHTPIVYSPEVGTLGRALRDLSTPVVERLDKIGEPPHIIHGHHSLETMAAVLHFPGVPALFVCHDCAAWHDTPPVFPRLLRYVAVDATCRERLVLGHGIPPERVELLFNGVDTERFAQRPPLPARPQRALIFSNYADHRVVGAVREACQAEGIQLDLAGKRLGGVWATPEERLGQYDLVFAKGRCAREAATVGCGVVVCDHFGVGPFVERANFERVNERNFGRRLVQAPLDRGAVQAQIRRYSATEAAAVSTCLREQGNTDVIHAQLVDLYREVIDEFAEQGPFPAEAESRAAGDFLEWCAASRNEMVRERARGRRWSAVAAKLVSRARTQVSRRWPRFDRMLASCGRALGRR